MAEHELFNLRASKVPGTKLSINTVAIDLMLECVAKGMPLKHALVAANISGSSYYRWIDKAQKDFREGRDTYLADLWRRLKRAESYFISTHLANISQHSVKNWQASAWLLERKYPDEFSLRQKSDGKTGVQITVLGYAQMMPVKSKQVSKSGEELIEL